MHCRAARVADAFQIAGRGIDRYNLNKFASRTSRLAALEAIDRAGGTFDLSRGFAARQEGIYGGACEHYRTAIWQRLQALALPCPDCVAMNAQPCRQFRNVKTAIGLDCVRPSPLPCHGLAFKLGRRSSGGSTPP